MREPAPSDRTFALLAVFSAPDALVSATRQVRDEGYSSIDALSPFPIDGLKEALGFSDNRVAWWALIGGVVGAVVGFGMQVYTVWDYPIDIGGRPLVAVPAFLLITFEVCVLCAVFAAVLAMLIFNHLPRLHHPLFDRPEFDLSAKDAFFLVIFANDPKFDAASSSEFLERLGPVSVALVGAAEEAE